jgi:hypothetical protein
MGHVPRIGRKPEPSSSAVKPAPASDTRPWQEIFLEFYARWGSISHAAKVARVTAPFVRKHQAADADFASRFEAAHEEFVDGLEKRLVEMAEGKAGFLATIARLKAERPNKYVDKLQVAGAVAHVHTTPPPDEIKALLRAMLADSLPETHAALAADTIDAEPMESL